MYAQMQRDKLKIIKRKHYWPSHVI